MDSSGIPARSGIWRASYRRDIASAILGCSEETARAFIEDLRKWCFDEDQFDHHCGLICNEVRSRLDGTNSPDNNLRIAILRNVMSGLNGSDAAVPQFELAAA